MPYEEYRKWSLYLERRPVGWREDHRTSLLMMSSGAKIVPEKIFPSLRQISGIAEDAPIGVSLQQSAFFLKMLDAKGGDKLEV